MNVAKLFQVLVVAGSSTTAGLAGCSSGSGGGSHGSGDGSSCASACKTSIANALWTDCDGCCCWLPVGSTCFTGSPICGNDPCCVGRGR